MADPAIEIQWSAEHGHWEAYVGESADVYLELWRYPGSGGEDEDWALMYVHARVGDDGWEAHALGEASPEFIDSRTHLYGALAWAFDRRERHADRMAAIGEPGGLGRFTLPC